MLEITDVHTTGSMAASMSKQLLWNHLNLGTINSRLRTEQSTKAHNSSQQRYYHMVNDPEVLVMDLGAAPIGWEQSALSLVVENTGIVPAEWLFSILSDLEEEDIEPENGSSRTCSSFNISPQRGYLQPEHKQRVCITYRHDSAAVNHELILFKVENGREVLLDFFGTTVESDQLCLHVPLGLHCFFPVSISCLHPPVQLLQMSPEFIDFGHMLLHERARRIVFLKNPSAHKHVMFSWRATHALMKKYLSVEPQHGVLKPNESQVCCVTFHAVGRPVILKLDIVCEASCAVSLVSETPQSQLLHLGVMVQTHAKPDFYSFFLGIQESPVVSSIESFMVEIQDEVLMKMEVPVANNWVSEELNILPDILAKIIQSLLCEMEFQHVLKELSTEPTLFFEQLRSQASLGHPDAALVHDEAPRVEHATRSKMNGARDGEVLPMVCNDHTVDKPELPQVRPLNGRGKDRVKRLPEFPAILLAVVEQTVQNVIAETG
uniref:CFAP65-like ninth Ig-like domain-containing protein n=1 Tax=Eptatretus burgeri TaxID=7764 RepID=A0A8C4R197_EPTBU